MKKFSKYINEGCVTADVNQGNAYSNTGVMNHLTPVANIVTQIRNLWGPTTGIVASVAEDGFSVKLNSSKFVSQEGVNKMLYDTTIMRGTSLASYIQQQGLTVVKIVNIGQFFVVYFCPNDIKSAGKVEEKPANLPCKEMQDYNIEETELYSLITESDEEEELKDITREKITELINSKDKVKAAKQLELLVAQELELPREYYFAGVKSKDGTESIALRWKYTKKRPHNKTIENVRSLMNIFDMTKDGIWVQDFDEDSLVKLPEEVEKLIHTILDFLGASETDNPAIWSLEEGGSRKEKKKDEDEDDDKKKDDEDDNKEDDDKKNPLDDDSDNKDKDNSDDEDNSDDLL